MLKQSFDDSGCTSIYSSLGSVCCLLSHFGRQNEGEDSSTILMHIVNYLGGIDIKHYYYHNDYSFKNPRPPYAVIEDDS